MSALIQSLKLADFFIKVEAKPVLKTDKYHVFEIADSEEDIVIAVKGHAVGRIRHLAIDRNQRVHLYSMSEENRIAPIGLCEIEKE